MRKLAPVLTLALSALVAGCTAEEVDDSTATDVADSATTSASPSTNDSVTQAPHESEGDAMIVTVLPQGDEPVELDPEEFSADVTNPWFPLEPGTRWTYRETTEEGEEVSVVVTATATTRTIANGVLARVVRDTVSVDGEIIEDTLDWYAQDAEGTVWYLGEDTAEFEDGRVTTRAGSFEAGVDGAQAGVIMPADPQVGMAYRQEFYEGQAEDNGQVLALGQEASVPAGDYDDLLQTADTTPLEPDVLEHKYYARGVGLVLTIDKESAGREELLSVTHISQAEARRAGEAPLGESY